jgi:magnesium transporter
MPKYKQIAKNIQQVTIDNPKTREENLTWLNINNAGKKEIEYLRKKLKFDLTHLHASSAKITAQRPSFTYNEKDHYIFLILHFPILKNGNIVSGEVDFFVKRGFLVTVHNNNIPGLNDFFNYCKKDGGSLISYKFESAAILLYEILKKLIENCYVLLDKNSIKISEIEGLIFSQKQKTAVSSILSLRRNVINFRKIIQNHKNILKKQMQRKSRLVPPEIIKKHYSELIEYSKMIWEILDNQKEMIEVLNDTNESLLNNRLNDIIKTLTIFSVIVFPLTLIAAIFGMNTLGGMPFVEADNGFWVIMVVMLAGCFGMLMFFKRKKWL